MEWDKKFSDISLYADISTLTADQVINLCGRTPDVIWASPDCTSYSIAGISFHRRVRLGKIVPISDYAKFCDMTNTHLLELIAELNPKYFFIENPVGALRKMSFMVDFEKKYAHRYTVTYCQYGDFRQKPTDIWTNHPDPQFRPVCKRGAPCHESSPRHANMGTTRLRKSELRAQIPDQLCEHIVNICMTEPKVKNYTLNDFMEPRKTKMESC